MARKSPQRPNAKEPKASAEKVAPDLDAAGSGSASASDAAAEPTGGAAAEPTGGAAAEPTGGAARQTGGTGEPAVTTADESDEDSAADDEARADESDAEVDRSLWTDTRVDPVEIALPAGVGYTLRAYRLSSALAPTDVEGREEDEDSAAMSSAPDLARAPLPADPAGTS